MNKILENNKYLKSNHKHLNNASNLYGKNIRNINADYVFCFLKNFDISSAIWVLYMVYKGLPLWQVGIAEGVFHLCSFLFEVPSGAIADLFGRKKTIIAGRILSILSAVMNLFATNILLFSMSFAVSALSYNLNSGSEEALVYDSLKEIDQEKDYIKVNSRLNMVIEVSQGLATFVGGILAEHSYVLCYLSVILISAASLIPAFLFTEPSISNNLENEPLENSHNTTANFESNYFNNALNDPNNTIINSDKNNCDTIIEIFKNSIIMIHFKNSIDILKCNKELLKVLIYFPVVETFNTVVYFYGQEYFSILGFNKIQISIIMLFSGILCCLGAYSSEKVISIFRSRAKYVASLLMAVSIILLSMDNIVLSVMFFGIMNFSNSILYPIQSVSLNELIPSNQRATIISISSMIFSLTMIIFFPLCGLMADIFNLHVTFMILGVIQIILIISLAKKIN
ncbi:MAG: MFS transporter [Clostridium sp.]|nr:MFS transporter [Clostridium sp.]